MRMPTEINLCVRNWKLSVVGDRALTPREMAMFEQVACWFALVRFENARRAVAEPPPLVLPVPDPYRWYPGAPVPPPTEEDG